MYKNIIIIFLTILLFSTSCSTGVNTSTATTTTGPTSTTISPTTTIYNQYQLEYLLFARYPDIFWCDPDSYPVARPEEPNAIEQFPAIRANLGEFSAILEHLKVDVKIDYTDAEKLEIYRQHKFLSRAINITASDSIINFSLREGRNQGWYVEGTVTLNGQIKELRRETSFNTCPICLTSGTRIDTPGGKLPVEDLVPGIMVWTVDKTGKRIAAPIIKMSKNPVPLSFEVVKLTLDDGRSVTASPGHPTSIGQALADYSPGDYLDGAAVFSKVTFIYLGSFTYDLLPEGGTGFYWANDILLMTTLARDSTLNH